MKKLGMYIHIPFCVQKCSYCDFTSFSHLEDRIPSYVDALTKEMHAWGEKLQEYEIKSIFIGGGTPSIVPIREMNKIISSIFRDFRCTADLEFSIESNPGTLNKEKLKFYLDSNINRLSIGLQAWQNSLLKTLGRIHDKQIFLENFEMAREIGFKNINVDLMFGLPNQEMSLWQETLHHISDLKPEHISTYSLKVEEGTPFGNLYEQGALKLPEEDLDREMYDYGIQYLKQHEYRHYEISNFCVEDKECEHNKIYWKNEEYIGLGLGAHSYLDKCRFSNTNDLNEYIKSSNHPQSIISQKEIISLEEQIAETMFLGLRMVEGIVMEEFAKRYGRSPLEIYSEKILRLKKQGLLEVNKGSIRLTRKGIDLSNQVFMEFLPDE